MDDSDIYVISDAGKSGNKSALVNSLQDRSGKSITKKHVRQVTLILAEDSLTNIGDKRGFRSINQVQSWYQCTKNVLQLNIHARLFTPGATNRGNVVGPLHKPSHENPIDNWIVTVADKFQIFGKHGPRIPVGGGIADPGADDDEPAEKVKTRNKADEEPLLYHNVPSAALRELLNSVDAVACISLAGEGKMAFECIMNRIPYFGVCFTETHMERLTRRLEASIFAAMQDSESKFFQPSLSKLLNSATPEGGSAGSDGAGAKAEKKGKRKTGEAAGATGGAQPGSASAKKPKGEGAVDLMAAVRAMAKKAAGEEGVEDAEEEE